MSAEDLILKKRLWCQRGNQVLKVLHSSFSSLRLHPSNLLTPDTLPFPMPLDETLLRDPSRPVNRIADRRLPYLRVLVEQFHPQQIILFGSYAYGKPDEHSDVDLLAVKPIKKSAVVDKTDIRMQWWPLMQAGPSFSFDLLLSDPSDHVNRLAGGSAYYREIVDRGLRQNSQNDQNYSN